MAVSKVYFTDFHTQAFGDGLPTKLKKLIRKAGIQELDLDGKFVAIKMHFGEQGNISYLRPNYARAVVDVVKELGGKPFLTDCNTMYPGSRKKRSGAPGVRLGEWIYPSDRWLPHPDWRRSEGNR